jgi:hypothetical protein
MRSAAPEAISGARHEGQILCQSASCSLNSELTKSANADGKAVEHWDTLQFVGDPTNSAPMIAPNIPRANPNGMF